MKLNKTMNIFEENNLNKTRKEHRLRAFQSPKSMEVHGRVKTERHKEFFSMDIACLTSAHYH